MAMSKKHYTAIADVFSEKWATLQALDDSSARIVSMFIVKALAARMVDVFAEDNPAFDPNRFWAAAFPTVEKETA